MFKIGDFSKLGQISVRMLRHYDQMGLLKPNQTDKFTSYRYYTIEQLPRLNRILALKDLGLSLEQIRDLLDKGVPMSHLQELLQQKQAELERELQENQARLARVAARLKRIEFEQEPSPYEITVKSVAAVNIVSLRQIVPHMHEMGYYCEQMYRTLYRHVAEAKLTSLGPEITLYHNDEYTEKKLDVEVALPLEPVDFSSAAAFPALTTRHLKAEESMACLIYEGSFQGLELAALALLTWVGLNQATMTGPIRELHLSGPAHQNGQEACSVILELQLPISRL